MKRIAVLVWIFAASLRAADDPWKALAFLEGTWEAKAAGGSAGATSVGTYRFVKELGGHVLARHSRTADCKGPADFDCDHGDLLYVFQDAPAQPLQAIYFDNEGHVLHYGVSTPAANRVVFSTDPAAPGPQFRLVYELNAGAMSGKFQALMPGQTEWKSYLEWSGARR